MLLYCVWRIGHNGSYSGCSAMAMSFTSPSTMWSMCYSMFSQLIFVFQSFFDHFVLFLFSDSFDQTFHLYYNAFGVQTEVIVPCSPADWSVGISSVYTEYTASGPRYIVKYRGHKDACPVQPSPSPTPPYYPSKYFHHACCCFSCVSVIQQRFPSPFCVALFTQLIGQLLFGQHRNALFSLATINACHCMGQLSSISQSTWDVVICMAAIINLIVCLDACKSSSRKCQVIVTHHNRSSRHSLLVLLMPVCPLVNRCPISVIHIVQVNMVPSRTNSVMFSMVPCVPVVRYIVFLNHSVLKLVYQKIVILFPGLVPVRKFQYLMMLIACNIIRQNRLCFRLRVPCVKLLVHTQCAVIVNHSRLIVCIHVSMNTIS